MSGGRKQTRTAPVKGVRGIDHLQFGADAPGIIRQVAHLPGFDPRRSGGFLALQEEATAADLLYRSGHLAYSKIKSIEWTITARVELLLASKDGAQ